MRYIDNEMEQAIARERSALDSLGGHSLLLTGSSGFLGIYFASVFRYYNRHYAREPIQLTLFDVQASALGPQPADLARDTETEIVGSLTDRARDIPTADYVLHFASIASPVVYRAKPLETIDVNVNGTWRIFEQAFQTGARSVLHMSSSEIYGDPDPRWIPTPESYWGNVSPVGPRACYDESKRLGETLAQEYARRGLPVKVVRPFNVFGPGQSLNDGRIVPDTMRSAVYGEDIVLYSDGTPTRSLCYIEDFFSGCMRALHRGGAGEPYNIGQTEEWPIHRIAEHVASVAGITVRYETSADQDYLTDNPRRRKPDLSKAMNDLGYQPEVGVAEGLERTYRCMAEAVHGDQAS